MGSNAAIFLDKDGTLIPDIPFNVNPDLVTLNPGVAEGLASLQRHYSLFVVSNQPGIGRGMFTMRALEEVKAKISNLLSFAGVKILDFYFCPHDSLTTTCNCSKPAPGMLLSAAREYGIELSQSWMIGDILNDIEAGNRAGCRSILINNGNETEWNISDQLRQPHFTAENFVQAADFITAGKLKI